MVYFLAWFSMVLTIDTLATMTGNYELHTLGYRSMDCAGDVNGDGYEDLVYTEGRYLYVEYPKAYILFGGAVFDNIPDVELYYSLQGPFEGRFGKSAGCAGDVNQDGYDDLMISMCHRDCYDRVCIYYGGDVMNGEPDITITNPPQVDQHYEFGHDLCLVDFGFDYNEPDEHSDIVVGCPTQSSAQGKVFVYRGPDFTQYVELANPLPFTGYADQLGFAVTAADYNNDTYDEIIVGAQYWDNARGAVVGYDAFGDLLYPDYIEGVSALDYFGHDLASGDVTNDDIPDLFISVYEYGNRQGQVRVSYGDQYWTLASILDIDQILTGFWPWDFFGCSIAHCDDIDNDGIGDVIVGACQEEGQSGYVAVYFGDNNELESDCDTVIYGESYWDAFGWKVCDAGDMNSDGFQEFAISAPYNDAGAANAGRVYVYGEVNLLSSDSLALAYNGNRHLARIPGNEVLHLVYTSDDNVFYIHSTNGGTDWARPELIGSGEFPAIALASDNLPSVAWTDAEGGLWYRRKTSATSWSDAHYLDDPTSPSDRHLNSPPAIAIHPTSRPNVVHILVTRSGLIPPYEYNYSHTVEDFSFPIDNPSQGWFNIIEEKLGPLEPPLRTFPSLARCEVDNSFHATWQRQDTICYAVKPNNDTWVNWGPQFYEYGLQSAHPFVETYGDSVFVVWQHLDPVTQKEDVYRARRYVTLPFEWWNFSWTSDLISLDPVNASGLFTVYAEEPKAGNPYDIYYKIRPYDDRINVSNTPGHSRYPQSAARFTPEADFHYTAWLEGDEAPYEIRFRKMQHLTPPDMAYLSSPNGQSAASPYLVARDGFVDDWEIPVDIGNATITYRFPLLPGYVYKAKAVVYHEGTGSWSGRLKCDNNLLSTVTYNANVPETLECWIPPALYADSVLTVSFERIAGTFAAIGPIYIYRYEYESGGGPMAQDGQLVGNTSVTVFPNPFTEKLNITYQTPAPSRSAMKLYDVTGRLVKQFSLPPDASFNHVIWDGLDDQGRAVPSGVYFLRIDSPDSGAKLGRKVLRVQ